MKKINESIVREILELANQFEENLNEQKRGATAGTMADRITLDINNDKTPPRFGDGSKFNEEKIWG
ncbi:hypothetical protein [Paenibacillus radicis (ex Xue et al. 2023)]|uniref:Uncharacterized protein n=1 Tax=Paenibacillus radicis (ex Xue et al. 2023) TaxID=2972489 RepID=A0ABT1YJV7_9BACL|nr:hypothetical protein [Paenibacillus radicis (ex Xue et al. 2023)]MCR8633444.1 hypothetical protein [Paenibacillus radicis (ex Xue et al. 2023)]